MSIHQGQGVIPTVHGQVSVRRQHQEHGLESDEQTRAGGVRRQRLDRRKSTRPAPSKSTSSNNELGSTSGSRSVVHKSLPSATAALPHPLTRTQSAIWFLSFLSSLGTSSIATRTLVGSSNSTLLKRNKNNSHHVNNGPHRAASSSQDLVSSNTTLSSSSSMVQLWYQLFSIFSFSTTSSSSWQRRPTSMSFTDTIPLSTTATATTHISKSNSAGPSMLSSSLAAPSSWRKAHQRKHGRSAMQPRAITIVMLLWLLCLVAPFSAPQVSAYSIGRSLCQPPSEEASGHRPPGLSSSPVYIQDQGQSSHERTLVKRQESSNGHTGPVSYGAVSYEARPISLFSALAVVNDTNLVCNGRADLCDLRYNQVTYAGTHNSAAYSLRYDCDTAVESCLQSTTYCVQQQQNCTKGWETRCTKMSNTCLDRLPKWLHWLCGAFTSVCESTEQFCLGWEQICTKSVDVCTLWGSACLKVIPEWLLPCLWENQPGHPVTQQLTDGIRFLDLGTCLTVDNSSVVMCHGFGTQRAIGVSLDSVLSSILDFYLKNPTEVITIEFNEADGDSADMAIMSGIIVQKMKQYFTLPGTGQSLMWSRSSSSEPWPTLREMILKNQRIMVFMGSVYDPIPDPKPDWANPKDLWKYDGFRYTYDDTTPTELNATYYKWCDQGPKNDGSYIQWQQIDINMAILVDELLDEVKAGKVPQICIEPLAEKTNGAFLEALASYCYPKWPYWFRVRVNNYWIGSVFKVTNLFNDMNVARVKASDPITPF